MTTIHDARTTLYHLSDIIIAHGDNIPTAKADAATTIRAKLERERERDLSQLLPWNVRNATAEYSCNQICK
jgi:UDP-2,3-diacylglucosamine pyrophosphatase LpxH